MRGFVFRPRVHRPAAARASRRPPCASPPVRAFPEHAPAHVARGEAPVPQPDAGRRVAAAASSGCSGALQRRHTGMAACAARDRAARTVRAAGRPAAARSSRARPRAEQLAVAGQHDPALPRGERRELVVAVVVVIAGVEAREAQQLREAAEMRIGDEAPLRGRRRGGAFTAAGRARSGKASTRSPSSSGRSSAAAHRSRTTGRFRYAGRRAPRSRATVASRAHACPKRASRWARGRKAFSSSWKRKVAVAMRAVWHRAWPAACPAGATHLCLTPASRSEGAGNGSRIYRAG